MPPTKVHDRITLVSAGLLIPVALAVPSDSRWVSCALLAGSHLLSGLFFSCDLDIVGAEFRRWGPLRWIWFPYARMVLHRSWLSHGPIVGPLLRLVYFALVLDLLVVLGALAAGIFGLGGPPWLNDWHRFWVDLMRNHSRRFVEFCVGFVLGGAVHTVPDWLQTWAHCLV